MLNSPCSVISPATRIECLCSKLRKPENMANFIYTREKHMKEVVIKKRRTNALIDIINWNKKVAIEKGKNSSIK